MFLPQELVVEILSRVPVKALLRFRCVSKAWNSLIIDPSFVELHLQRSSKNSNILLRFETVSWEHCECGICLAVAPCSISCLLENTSSTIHDSVHLFNPSTSVSGSCNGLVCLLKSSVGFKFGKYKFRIWNPATRTMSRYSPCLWLRSRNYLIWASSLVHGFGFDDWSHTYKVVVILTNMKSETKEVRVHCLGDTCWRKILTFTEIDFQSELNGQYVNGTVNWLARHMTLTINHLVIFSYDLKRETYRFVLVPKDYIEDPEMPPYLGVMKGCLYFSHDYERTHLVVWLMREYGVEKSWTQLLKLTYEHLQSIPFCIPMPLCVSLDEDVVLLADHRGCKFVLYDRRDCKVYRTEGFNNDSFSYFTLDYVPSLVLPYQN